MKNKSFKWMIVAGVAAFVAVLTTIAVLMLRARSRKTAWYDEQASFDYDEDDLDKLDLENDDEPAVGEE